MSFHMLALAEHPFSCVCFRKMFFQESASVFYLCLPQQNTFQHNWLSKESLSFFHFTSPSKINMNKPRMNSQRWKQQAQDLHQMVCVYILVISLVFLQDSSVCGWVGLSDFCSGYWESFPSVGLPCPTSIWELSSCHIVSCFVLFVFSWRPVFFLNRKQRGSGSGRVVQGSWRIRGEEIMIRIYYMRKNLFFNKRKGKKN